MRLVVDEAGDVKKDTSTVGVSSSTPAQPATKNSRVAVYLAYSTPRGHAVTTR